jgi:hypothetical protein
MTSADVLEELLTLIGEAARSGNVARIEKLTQAAKALTAKSQNTDFAAGTSAAAPTAEDTSNGIFSKLRQKYHIPAQPPAASGAPANSRSTRKARGKATREDWLSARRHDGILLSHVRGRLYENAKRARVGIASATELLRFPDKWWLGLPDGQYEVIVLLCKDSAGTVLDFVIPWKFLDPIWISFSRSSRQVEFHVERRGSKYVLPIPGQQPQAIDHFMSNYGDLA